MLYNLRDIFALEEYKKAIIPCFNVFGQEDCLIIIEVAEELNMPVILAVNKDYREFISLKVITPMLLAFAQHARVPVCIHLDHCYEVETIFEAIDLGFTSVMYDGSQLSVEENIANSLQVIDIARKNNVSVEGEIGSVSYAKGRDYIKNELTKPDEAKRYFEATQVDSLAVSIGNVHRLDTQSAQIDFDLLKTIEQSVDANLCLHGASGIKDENIQTIVKKHRIRKMNISNTIQNHWSKLTQEKIIEDPIFLNRFHLVQSIKDAMKQKVKHLFKLCY